MLREKKHNEIETTLLAELRAGSRTAFDALYERYKADVYQEANKRLHDPELAKDITQDVFTALWEKASQSNIDNLPGYLFISVRNKVLRTIQRQDKFVPVNDLLIDLTASKDQPEQELIYKDLLSAYTALIDQLPEQQRIIYKMRYIEYKEPDEIAEILKLSPKTVRNHLGRAIASLRAGITLLQILIYLNNR